MSMEQTPRRRRRKAVVENQDLPIENIEIDFIMVADWAETINGKLYIQGAGWDRLLRPPKENPVVGFAIDYLTFTRPCADLGCNSLFEILQESVPDLGDFDNHFLGVLLAHPTQASAAEVYAYDCPKRDSWNGSLLNPESDRSHLLLAETTDGLTLFIVHDRPDEQQDLDGGQAEM